MPGGMSRSVANRSASRSSSGSKPSLPSRRPDRLPRGPRSARARLHCGNAEVLQTFGDLLPCFHARAHPALLGYPLQWQLGEPVGLALQGFQLLPAFEGGAVLRLAREPELRGATQDLASRDAVTALMWARPLSRSLMCLRVSPVRSASSAWVQRCSSSRSSMVSPGEYWQSIPLRFSVIHIVPYCAS